MEQFQLVTRESSGCLFEVALCGSKRQRETRVEPILAPSPRRQQCPRCCSALGWRWQIRQLLLPLPGRRDRSSQLVLGEVLS